MTTHGFNFPGRRLPLVSRPMLLRTAQVVAEEISSPFPSSFLSFLLLSPFLSFPLLLQPEVFE